jgi:hypothetical protein
MGTTSSVIGLRRDMGSAPEDEAVWVPEQALLSRAAPAAPAENFIKSRREKLMYLSFIIIIFFIISKISADFNKKRGVSLKDTPRE